VESKGDGLVLALGSGGARGLAHIGVLEVLEEQGLPIRAIVGCSIGAEIGALYAHYGDAASLVRTALGFGWKQTLQLFLPDIANGGVSSGRKIIAFLESYLGTVTMADLRIPFLAVATDLESGKEVVLRDGSVVAAVRASLSLPGLLAPCPREGRLLIDGGVVNPVPSDVAARAFGGPVVAVGVHQDAGSLAPSDMTPRSAVWRAQARTALNQPWLRRAKWIREWLDEPPSEPVMGRGTRWHARSVLAQAINITQAEVVRLRLLAEPPALYLSPNVDAIGPFEFYKAQAAIEAGRAIAREHLAELHALVRVSEQANVSGSNTPGSN